MLILSPAQQEAAVPCSGSGLWYLQTFAQCTHQTLSSFQQHILCLVVHEWELEMHLLKSCFTDFFFYFLAAIWLLFAVFYNVVCICVNYCSFYRAWTKEEWKTIRFRFVPKWTWINVSGNSLSHINNWNVCSCSRFLLKYFFTTKLNLIMPVQKGRNEGIIFCVFTTSGWNSTCIV